MWAELTYRLRALFRRNQMEHELQEELQFHLDRASNQPPADFGGIEQIKEACRDERGIGAIDRFRQDLRYAWRMFVKYPGFSAAVVVSLGLGIGGATTMFGVVDSVLLKPLPYRDADRIVRIGRQFGGVRVSATSAVDYDALASQAQTLAAVAVARRETVDLSGGAEPLRVDAAVVSASFFDVLGVAPARGQAFVAGDDRPGSRRVAILSDGLSRRLGARASPGQTLLINVNGEPHHVVAVMPRGFRAPEALGQQDVDLWLPLGRVKRSTDADDAAWGTIGTVKAGFEDGAALQEIEQIGRRLAEAGGGGRASRFWIAPLRDETIGESASGLWLIFGAIALLLLLACTNVANLFLVRAVERSKEIAVRATLGAGRGRIARQLVTETMLYALAGGVLGVMLSRVGIGLVRAWAPADLPRVQDLQVDGSVMTLALGIAVLCGLVFGIAPALVARRSSFATILRAASGTITTARGAQRQRATMVVVQTALAVMLVVGASLLANSVRHLANVDPGFDPADVAWLDLTLPERAYAGPAPKIAFFDELLRSARVRPGIDSAALIQGRPLGGGNGVATVAPQEKLPAEGEQPARVPVHVVSPGYFATLRIPAIDGRDFSEDDHASSERVAVVSRSFANRFWPDERAVGKRFWMGRIAADAPLVEVVGVVEDVRQYALADEPIPMVYRALAQLPRGSATLVARHGAGGAPAAIEHLRKSAAALDSALPLDRHGTLAGEVSRSIREPRFRALALSAFGVIACAIAAIGLYGALAWLVRTRHRELGVRVALGADPRRLGWMVIRRGLLLASAGVAIGLASAAAGSRLLASLLFGITPTNGPAFAAAAVILLVVAALASWIPARRASRVDALVVLKDDR